HARVRGRVNDPVGIVQGVHVAGAADVAVPHEDARALERWPGVLAAAPAEIVDAGDPRGALEAGAQGHRQLAADKATDAGNDDVHLADKRPTHVSTISRMVASSEAATRHPG